MRVLKWIGFALLAVVLLLGAAFAYTARAPYEVPDRLAAVQAAREFAPGAPRRPGERTVIVWVFDGFAASTLRAAEAPHLARMAREGGHT
jgi:hypothetical protein